MEHACLHRRYQAHFSDGRFSEACQACYVVACCGAHPKRLSAMNAQLEALRPLKDVDICIFEGHKNCPLSEHSAHDISVNFLYVFRDSLNKGASRAFILEDDFKLEAPLHEDDVSEIVKFLQERNPCVYGLGNYMIPTMGTIFSRHQKASSGYTSSHACFYSREYMRKVVDFFEQAFANRIPPDFHCFDHWPELFKANIYRYYKPLITQIFEQTENQKEGWARCRPASLTPHRVSACLTLLRLLNLDKKTQPGWKILYFLGNFGPFIGFALLALALLAVLRS